MKKLLLLAVTFVAGLTVMAQSADQLIKVSTSYNFGNIKQHVPVTTFLEIKNISGKPVVIENAWAGCGCTTPEVTKEPIPAGGSTKIKIGYNAAALGHFDKPVNVKLAGVNDPLVITISGEVLEAAAYDAQAKNDDAKKSSAKTETKSSAVEKTTVKVKKSDKKEKRKVKTSASE